MEHAGKIGALQAEVQGLRAQHKEHSIEIKADIKDLTEKVDDIVAIVNKGKGAWWTALLFAGTIGSLIVKGFSMVIAKLFP